MDKELKVLSLEDNETDAELINITLRRSKLQFKFIRVDNAGDFLAAIEQMQPDIILADFNLPQLTALEAMELMKERGIKTPLILVTGSQSDETAAECIKRGADDYILKSSLTRLPTAVVNAIRKHEAVLAQERAQRALLRSLEFNRLITENMSEAIVLCSMEEKILYWNKGAERLYGWSEPEVVGRNRRELFFKVPDREYEEARTRVLEQGSWKGEFQHIRKDGKEVIVDSRWTLVKHGDGDGDALLVVNTDITERKKLEAQFLRAQRMESLGTLASGIAHDLNNVLAPILLSIQLLKARVKEEKGQQMLLTMEASAQRGAELVKQVLSFGRGLEGKRADIQLKHLVTEIEKVARGTFPKSIYLAIDVPSDLWTVSADATQLHQVLMNLVVNARDAMPKGGKLTINCENFFIDENYAQMEVGARPGPYVIITVSDTGSGIPPDVLERIFEPFFTTKEIGKGTGLGLSTVLTIVRSHEGFVKVESEVGQGTTFRIHLPAANRQESVSPSTLNRLPLEGRGETILVVDDEASIREITRTTLEELGYRVITACDGIEAISIFAESRDEIDLVMTDMMMPNMDGANTIRAIRRIDPEIRVIAVSGLHARTRGLTGQLINGRLVKPFTAEELLEMLRKVLAE